MESVNVLGVRVNTVPAVTLVEFAARVISQKSRARIVYVNTHAINLATELTWFRNLLIILRQHGVMGLESSGVRASWD